MTKKELFHLVLEYFQKHRPVAETELVYTNPYELIVAVILSAQCTDKRVNIITPKLLEKFPTIYDMANATPDEVFTYIKSCSYPNNKAKHLVNMAKTAVEKFNGEIPSEVELLQQLPGVGRKTANVIAAVAYDKPAIAVDTHVFRVSARLGLTTGAKTPLETEKQLVKYIPEDLRSIAHHWLILHGRYVCLARKPKCHECGLAAICRYKNKNFQNNKPELI
ncbi:MAG: endonuclease III [Bacteroidales bacterium]|nr:endonuclease III [Bacteroidales bacterium]